VTVSPTRVDSHKWPPGASIDMDSELQRYLDVVVALLAAIVGLLTTRVVGQGGSVFILLFGAFGVWLLLFFGASLYLPGTAGDKYDPD
jgi:hypothetical protein